MKEKSSLMNIIIEFRVFRGGGKLCSFLLPLGKMLSRLTFRVVNHCEHYSF